MPVFRCPVCGEALQSDGRSLRCSRGHNFDLARQGYVCLMPMGAHGKRHGDDKLMVDCRRDFLEKGCYEPIRAAVTGLALSAAGKHCDLLDVGCGEGWYTEGLLRAMEAQGIVCSAAGIDISRDALKACAGRKLPIRLAIASCARLPLADGSCDLVLNLFSPPEYGEYARVLRPGGYLLRAVPREKHLFSLKAAVYDTPYLNPPPPAAPEGFETAGIRDVDAPVLLRTGEDIQNLFRMTPYWYKTGVKDQQRLAALTELDTALSVRVELLKKIN